LFHREARLADRIDIRVSTLFLQRSQRVVSEGSYLPVQDG
jgi:hypothetical protein